jgi:hypothetical protein
MPTSPKFRNPFSDYRWEWESSHIVWLPPKTIQRLSAATPIFLSGIRGTGKTTLLQVLDPRVRAHPATTILNPQHLNSDCIGVYVYILGEYITLFKTSALSPNQQEQLFYIFFYSYVFSQMFETIRYCRGRRELSYDPVAEEKIAARLESRFKLSSFCRGVYPPTNFGQLAFVLSKICETIRSSLLNGEIEDFALPLLEISPATLHAEVSRQLLRYKILVHGEIPRFIKICIDDAHRIPPPFQICINKVIQEPNSPITWCVAFIAGRYAFSQATSPDDLTGDDRIKIELDYPDDQDEFRQICRNLFVARLKQFFNPGTQVRISDRERESYINILGRVRSRELFLAVLQDPAAGPLRTEINENVSYVGDLLKHRTDIQHGKNSVKLRRKERADYFYQTYIYLRLFQGRKDEFDNYVKAERFDDLDNYFRQKVYASVLCAAAEVGKSPQYCGYAVFETLADGCVREFLKMMMSLYEIPDVQKTFEEVLTGAGRESALRSEKIGTINRRSQTVAIKNTAHQYFQNMAGEIEAYSYFNVKLLHGLGRLIRMLQTKDIFFALRNPDFGKIRVNFQDADYLHPRLLRRLKGALMHGLATGSLRQLNGFAGFEDDAFRGHIEFRLHRIVAAHYDYSYRGPFRVFQLDLVDLAELIAAPDFGDIEGWVEGIYSRKESIAEQRSDLQLGRQLMLDLKP